MIQMSRRQYFIYILLFLIFVSGLLRAETIALTTTNYPPYQFEKPTDGLRGTDVEIVEAALERVQISTEFQYFPWKRGLEKIKRGLSPAIFNCSYKKVREEFILYSNQINQQTTGYYVRRDFSGFEPSSVQEAKGLKVGGVLGWAMSDTMKEAGANLVTYRTEELVFKNLLKGVVDYAYLSLESSGFGAKRMGIASELRFIKNKEKPLYVCFSKKWPDVKAIVDKFNQGLAEIRKDGSYDRIIAKYR